MTDGFLVYNGKFRQEVNFISEDIFFMIVVKRLASWILNTEKQIEFDIFICFLAI